MRDIYKLAREGFLEPLLDENEIKLSRAELELLDIVYCSDDIADLNDWKKKYGENIHKYQQGIISKFFDFLADNSIQLEMFELQEEYSKQTLSEYDSESTDRFKED